VRVVVCLPTYNERENLEPMVRALDDVVRTHGLDARVLVIDDSSPDGTGELADRLSGRYPFLAVLHRPKKEGLGPAYVAGFLWALAADADRIVEIDCDFSHDPHDLPRLVAATDSADLALGSRYVDGGGTRNWGLGRRAVSRFGSVYARALLGVGVRDLTGGFKCFRRAVLEQIGLERISSKGYAFQIETTYRALRAGFRVVEVPIVFSEREAGGSKMSRGIVFEAMAKVPALRARAALGRL
jgi:dolichol-phosphate mannosyltransferase